MIDINTRKSRKREYVAPKRGYNHKIDDDHTKIIDETPIGIRAVINQTVIQEFNNGETSKHLAEKVVETQNFLETIEKENFYKIKGSEIYHRVKEVSKPMITIYTTDTYGNGKQYNGIIDENGIEWIKEPNNHIKNELGDTLTNKIKELKKDYLEKIGEK